MRFWQSDLSFLGGFMSKHIAVIVVALISIGSGEAHATSTDEPVFEIKVSRNMTCKDESTIGRLTVDGKVVGRTLELPWRNNEPGISRIPAGTYSANMRTDGKRGWRLQLKDVKDRKWVQIHIGNYQRQIEGCILVGKNVSTHGDKCMVTHSKDTLGIIRDALSELSKDESAKMTRTNVPVTVVVTE